MKRFAAFAVLTVVVGAIAGCSFKMGNAQMELFEGLNQPSGNMEKIEKTTPAETKEVK